MIFFDLLMWASTLFCIYTLLQRLWWMYLDRITMQMYTEWPGLEYPTYGLGLYRDASSIALSYRALNPVIYYPFVYKGRYVQLRTSMYSHRKWNDDTPGLRRQLIIIN